MKTQHQDDLPLASVRPHVRFPGRETLYVSEVATVLRCSLNHVINLIREYEDTGGKSGLKGFSIARAPEGKPMPRSWWRVAVSDFDRFLESRATSHT